VLVVDKPGGVTSHDVVVRVRRALAVERAGHTGTLDPFATGVLPVCLGRAVRLARFLSAGDKVYRAGIRLGVATTTDDVEGEPLGEAVETQVTPEALREACRGLTGPLQQVPPAFSAKRVGGRRLYELARRGQPVQPAPVAVHVHSFEVLEQSGERVDVEVRCSPGTYVRALARDLGQRLGCGAHLVTLRRLRSGEFGLEQAVAWDDLTGPGERVVPMRSLLPGLPAVSVGEQGREDVRHGRALAAGRVLAGFPEAETPWLRVLDEGGELLALATCRGVGPPAPGLSLERALHPAVVLV